MSADRRQQRGQVLVIFAGGMVALLVVAALVIDLGFTFLIRRAEQNAADPGAIAAARFIRANGAPDLAAMRQAACFYARQNGFFANATNDTQCLPAFDPAGTVLTVNYPPTSGPFIGTPGYVEVALTRQHQSLLANIVKIFSFTVTTNAVAAFSDGDSNSSSLIALDPTSCSSGKVHGGGAINIAPITPGTPGGYIHVNSTCASGTPNTACESAPKGGLDITGGGTITAPGTYVSGTCKRASGNLAGPLTEGAVQIGDPLLELAPPSFGQPNPGAECGVGTGKFTTPTGAGAGGCKFNGSGTYNLVPGVYYGGWDISSHPDLVLAPGIYVIAGGGIKLSAGGTITSVQGASGVPAPVMFYNTDNPVTKTGQSGLDFNATGDLKLRAIDTGPYKGILVWNDGKGSNAAVDISLGGQATFDIGGTIYNPKGSVTLEGGSGVSTNSAAVQVISWSFDIGGNATLNMPYDPGGLYGFDHKGLVR